MNAESIWYTAKTIILIILSTLFLIGGYKAFAEWKNHFELKNKLIEEQMIKLSENLVSQRAEINTELLKQRIKELDDRIIELVKSRDEKINDIGQAVSSMKQSFHESNSIYHNDEDESKDYDEVVIFNKDIIDSDGEYLPLGWSIYSPNINGENKWTVGNYKLNFDHKIILAENDDRLDVFMEAWITTEGYFPEDQEIKKFPLKIDKVNWVRREPKNKWMFNLRLNLGVSIGNDIYPSLGLSTFSYGKTKRDMDWKFLNVSLGLNSEDVFFQLSPIEYNIGNHVPLIENIFTGPYLNINTDSIYGIGINTNVPF